VGVLGSLVGPSLPEPTLLGGRCRCLAWALASGALIDLGITRWLFCVRWAKPCRRAMPPFALPGSERHPRSGVIEAPAPLSLPTPELLRTSLQHTDEDSPARAAPKRAVNQPRPCAWVRPTELLLGAKPVLESRGEHLRDHGEFPAGHGRSGSGGSQ